MARNTSNRYGVAEHASAALEVPTTSPALALADLAQGVPVLDPRRLAPEAQQAIASLLQEGESASTVRSYQAALRYWAGWFYLRYREELRLPVPVPAVLQFIVDHAASQGSEGLAAQLPAAVDEALVTQRLKGRPGPLSLATLDHRLSVLSRLHGLKQEENPCQTVPVRTLMAKVRSAYAKRGTAPKRQPALTKEPLAAVLATCDDSIIGARDRALLLFAWATGGRRRSEVAEARVEHLHEAGAGAYVYRLPRSKAHPTGEPSSSNEKPVVGAAAAALTCWLQRAAICKGPLFRRIRRGGHVCEQGLSGSAIRDIVLSRSLRAGLPPHSAHSLRSGFVTEAARQNMPLPEAMAMTGHKSLEVFRGYFRADPTCSPGAQQLVRSLGLDPDDGS